MGRKREHEIRDCWNDSYSPEERANVQEGQKDAMAASEE